MVGGGRVGSQCLMRTEFVFGKFCGWTVVMVAKSVNVLNAIKLYVHKWLKWQIYMMYILTHTTNKKNVFKLPE